jgi:hypothetical protein
MDGYPIVGARLTPLSLEWLICHMVRIHDWEAQYNFLKTYIALESFDRVKDTVYYIISWFLTGTSGTWRYWIYDSYLSLSVAWPKDDTEQTDIKNWRVQRFVSSRLRYTAFCRVYVDRCPFVFGKRIKMSTKLFRQRFSVLPSSSSPDDACILATNTWVNLDGILLRLECTYS